MYYYSVLRLLVSIVMLFSCIHSYLAERHYKRSNANGNVFNLLLGLYKINPLKGSDVYRSFSDKLLLGRSEKAQGYKANSDEIGKGQLKESLNEIEKIIHLTTKKPSSTFVKPAYDVDDVSTENFKVDIVVNEKYMVKDDMRRIEDEDDFNSILGHLSSNEVKDIPVTKLLPVNATSAFEPFYEIVDNNVPSSDNFEFRDKSLDEAPSDTKIEELPEVIVL
ncbi:uncharacterized protein LOC124641739 [Helicoverpa zea]|uniref:uncharacterized protein LOC124641739 n=1 Tax=Helicoverpa zea TaxID=7113 RepID=UPI001F56E0D6|nr:uncharacterized protein LOC124641739 [Helicoverpa zea]